MQTRPALIVALLTNRVLGCLFLSCLIALDLIRDGAVRALTWLP